MTVLMLSSQHLSGWCFDVSTVERMIYGVIYQTRDTVFHHISNTEKRVENTTRSRVSLRFLIL